ncbi:ParB/RepB/Spo0J family partition protein [Brachybacterium sp. DNPG3]
MTQKRGLGRGLGALIPGAGLPAAAPALRTRTQAGAVDATGRDASARPVDLFFTGDRVERDAEEETPRERGRSRDLASDMARAAAERRGRSGSSRSRRGSASSAGSASSPSTAASATTAATPASPSSPADVPEADETDQKATAKDSTAQETTAQESASASTNASARPATRSSAKTPAKKAPARKAPAKKAPAEKAPAKKTPAKRSTATTTAAPSTATEPATIKGSTTTGTAAASTAAASTATKPAEQKTAAKSAGQKAAVEKPVAEKPAAKKASSARSAAAKTSAAASAAPSDDSADRTSTGEDSPVVDVEKVALTPAFEPSTPETPATATLAPEPAVAEAPATTPAASADDAPTEPTEPTESTGQTSTDGEDAPAITSESELLPVPGAVFAEIPINEIRENPRNPRTLFDDEELDELAFSLREVGVLQPVVVRSIPVTENGESFELVMGERRWRAARRAGLATIPAIIRETSDDDLLRDALLENLHRSQLNPLEEANAYQQLLEDFGCTQDELGERIGRSRPQISNTLRLLRLPALVQRRLASGALSAGHARALLSLDDPALMEELAQRIVTEGLSVRAVERLVSAGGAQRTTGMRTARRTSYDPHVVDLTSRLANRLETQVRIDVGKRKGRITLEFTTIDDLERLISTLGVDPTVEEDGESAQDATTD